MGMIGFDKKGTFKNGWGASMRQIEKNNC